MSKYAWVTLAFATIIGIDVAVSIAQKRTAAELVDALHAVFGDHHVRAMHAKGVALEGTFAPDPKAAALVRAPHLQRTSSKVIARFSDGTGLPDIADTAPEAKPVGFAVRFTLPDGTSTDILANTFNGFPVATAEEFRDLLNVTAASGPGAVKPTALDRFLASHPVAKTFLTTQVIPASFATVEYFGVNAFEVTNKDGATHAVRYQITPVAGERLLTAAELATKGPNYLVDEIATRVAGGPIQLELYAQLAEHGDKVDDPSVAWPATRQRVKLGTITLTKLAPATAAADKALAFSPTNLVDGIRSADPMIDVRGLAYPISVKGRR